MSEINNINIIAKIEDNIKAALDGDNKKNALDFVAHLMGTGMTPEITSHPMFKYMDEFACLIVLIEKNENSPFGMWFACCWGNYDVYEHDNFPVDEGLKEFAQANVKKCFNCGGCDTPKGCKMIFGKEYDGVCCNVFHFDSPNSKVLENAKTLMELQKYIIADAKN